jgi:hypothetical protein
MVILPFAAGKICQRGHQQLSLGQNRFQNRILGRTNLTGLQ